MNILTPSITIICIMTAGVVTNIITALILKAIRIAALRMRIISVYVMKLFTDAR